MITTRVRVLRAADGIAWVRASESSGCAACASRSACGVGEYSGLFGRGLVALPAASARPGQELTVEMEEGDLLRAGLFAYLLPVILALVGAALLAERGDVASLLGALLGLGTGLLVSRWLARTPTLRVRGACNDSFIPHQE